MQLMKTTEKNVCKALKIGSNTYSEMMYECGCAYLEERKKNLINDTGCKEENAEKYTAIFRNSKIWWNWWRREWEAVDRKFLRLQNQKLSHYEIMQEGRIKIPPSDDVDLILDNYLIVKELSETALLITTDKQILNNDDSKSILHSRRDKKVFPRQRI